VVLAWAFFPGPFLFPHVVRVTVPLFVAMGLLVLNQRMLARDGFPADALGMNMRRFGWFIAGGLIVAPIILLIAGELWLLAPFHWERGSLTWAGLSWQTAEYLGGNLGEELIFRGYLLLLFTRHFGLTRALFIVALLFGLFHLPGLSAWTAVKMVCTTAAMSFLFAYGFSLTGSLWTAVGLHVFGNVFLHQVFGMSGGSSFYSPVPDAGWPKEYDPGFCAEMSITTAIVFGAGFVMKRLNSRL